MIELVSLFEWVSHSERHEKVDVSDFELFVHVCTPLRSIVLNSGEIVGFRVSTRYSDHGSVRFKEK